MVFLSQFSGDQGTILYETSIDFNPTTQDVEFVTHFVKKKKKNAILFKNTSIVMHANFMI